jgi:hypothetical protein
MVLKTQLQGSSGPGLLVLRNPSPWHCVQDSFDTAMVSEWFQLKLTNLFLPNLTLNSTDVLILISHHFMNTVRNIT